MNTSNQNHDPAQSGDLPDRLVDLALSELIGGNAPPDLSSRIAAATPRQPAAVRQAPRTHYMRAYWASLAIAATLLIGVTVVLLNPMRSSREQSRLILKESAKQDRLDNVRLSGQAVAQGQAPNLTGYKTSLQDRGTASSARPLTRAEVDAIDIAKGMGRVTGPADFDGPAEQRVRATELSLDVSQSQPVAPPAPAQTGTRVTVPSSTGETITLFNPVAPRTSYRYLWNNQDRYGAASGGAAKGKTEGLALPAMQIEGHEETLGVPLTSLADNNAFYEAQVPGLINESISGEDRTKQVGLEYRGYAWKYTSETTEGIGPDLSGDQYARIVENPFIKAEGGAAVSTFSIDVDTASYANVRQFLMQMNQLPPPDAVRIEELVNYFQYDYAPPNAGDTAKTPSAPGSAGGSTEKDSPPFAAHVEVTACPWAPEHRLARIGIKGREMDRAKRPQSNLVFLIDVSGSMNEPNKLPLVINGLEQLTRELGENDKIAIVVYASSEGLVLPSTRGDKQDTILAALAKLKAGGSTAGGAGIQLAYQLAEDNFIKGGTNRVILCTDGDFNVGVTSTAELERMVEKKAKDTGVFLSVLGFGRGNLNDTMMEAISNHGNGNYHYVDNRSEARRVLVEQMTGTLITIAKDVKIQVEFNPAQVAAYRLIGYENRMLRTEDFNDDKKDAGEIGAGHTVTALYEIVPAGKKVDIAPDDPLKYQQPPTEVAGSNDKPSKSANLSKELLTLKMRYKAPDGDTSKKLEWPITDDGKAFAAASGDLKFAASVAGFGLMLRNSQHKGNLTYAATLELAQGGIGDDPHGYRKEFLDMVRKAKELRHE